MPGRFFFWEGFNHNMLGPSGLTLPNEKCITDCDADAESTVPFLFLKRLADCKLRQNIMDI